MSIDEQPKICVTFTLTEHDLYTIIKDNVYSKKNIFLTVCFLVIVTLISGAYITSQGRIAFPINIIFPVVFIGIASIAAFPIINSNYKKVAHNNYESDKSLQKESILEIYKDKYITKSEVALIVSHFDNFIKFIETKNNFIFYTAPNINRHIPKRIFNNEELNIVREIFKVIKTK